MASCDLDVCGKRTFCQKLGIHHLDKGILTFLISCMNVKQYKLLLQLWGTLEYDILIELWAFSYFFKTIMI